MDIKQVLKQFLIEQKLKDLELEKRATGTTKDIVAAQIRVYDAILIFLSSQQTEEDMGKLQLTLQKKPIPLKTLKPRQDNEELTEALIEAAQILTEPESAIPLDNLPPDVKLKSVSTKIYGLRVAGKLPAYIKPTQRGKDLWLTRLSEEDARKEEEKLRRKAGKLIAR